MADDVLSRLRRLLTGAQRAWDDHADAVADEEKLSAPEAFVHFWVLTVRSFVRNRVPVRAAALAYSSLLALVPMLALVLTIGLGFLRGDEGDKHLDLMIQHVVGAVVPTAEGTESAQKETVKKLKDFVNDQKTSAVSAGAAVMLIYIAIMMLSRIEDTFNDIWGVQRGRSWFARVTQYWAALTLGPVLLILVIGLTSSTELAAFQAKLARMPLGIGQLTAFLFKFLPFALLSVGFAAFYALLPATKVNWRAALAGGIVGGTLWQLNNLLSVLYVSRVVSNSKVYGSLGLVPVVMIGLYFSWVIMLFGAQVAYSFQNRRAYFQERQVENLDQRSREFVGLRIMVEIGRRFLAGEKPVTGAALSELLGVPTRLAGKILQALVGARLLAESQQGETAYLPARPLEKISCHDVLIALRTSRNGSVATREDAMRGPVREHYERFQEVEQSAAGKVTLAALAAEAAAASKPAA
ncbi:MAG: Ribonuclease BN [Limisphaerales bacterium]|nr:MAG: Ribonuclease BN [Limisphaerales bacterium]KAG0510725.1 MAG: Ribonuclease BN [Limisphaerales bacterium]TXT52621.1 MAG: Ribonuclease BN [Limisphaerales bacterium]